MVRITKRVKTGIEGFDNLIEGGLPRNSMTLVSGSPGTGKTTFGLQYIYNGATKFGENGVFVTLSEPIESLKSSVRRFGMYFDKLEKQNKVIFIKPEMKDRFVIKSIKESVRKVNAKRIVIDSLSNFAAFAPFSNVAKDDIEKFIEWGKDFIIMPAVIGDSLTRVYLHKLIDDIRSTKCTSLLISELPESDGWLSSDKISEFICDGIILMRALTLTGEIGRSLTIKKMRMTKHKLDVHGLEMSKTGLKILPAERGVKI